MNSSANPIRSKLKLPVLRSQWPKIRDLRPSGHNWFMVDARPHSKREYFATLAEAKTRADQLACERDNRGVEAVSFSTESRVMAVECMAKLNPYGKTLRDAVDHYCVWLESEERKNQSLCVSACLERYLVTREADFHRGELAQLTIYEIRERMEQLRAAIGKMRILAVTTGTVRTFLDSMPVSNRTKLNVRLRLSKFFNYCKENEWITQNPCSAIAIKVRRTDTRILSVADTRRLLEAAETSPYAQYVVPYAAVALFAGLRPGEAEQLDWKNIDFPTATIEVLGHTSKTRDTRFVRMEPTLVEWLKPFRKSSGRVVGDNFRKEWESVKRAVGYDPAQEETRWVTDILRHTYASYWLGIHQNRAHLAELMGNSVEVIKRHYRRPIAEADARCFWALTPYHH